LEKRLFVLQADLARLEYLRRICLTAAQAAELAGFSQTRNGGARGNSLGWLARHQLQQFHPDRKNSRHSREGGNPGVCEPRHCGCYWIPAPDRV
jgi:hypothetical protein